MCYLISVAVASSDLNVLGHFRGFELSAVDCVNPTVKEALGRTAVYDITEHGCSCSLHRYDAGVDASKVRRRYAKKGWTAARVERAIESASRSRTNARTARDRFVDALAALCLSGASVRLLSHEYCGRSDQETFELSTPLRMSVRALSEQPFADDAIITLDS